MRQSEQEEAAVPADSHVWEEIEQLESRSIPMSVRRALGHNPWLLAQHRGNVQWTQAGSFLSALRDLLDAIVSELPPLVVDDQDELIVQQIGGSKQPGGRGGSRRAETMNYHGAVSFSIARHAEQEHRELLNILRRPMLRYHMAYRAKEHREKHGRSKEGREQASQLVEQWEAEIRSASVIGLGKWEALHFLREVADGSAGLAEELNEAAAEARACLHAYANTGIPTIVQDAFIDSGMWSYVAMEVEAPVYSLEFEDDDGVQEVLYTQENEYLKVLNAAGAILAAKFRWARSVAVPFILCDAIPITKTAKVTYDIRTDLPCTSRITLEVDPALTVDEVSRVYRSALEEIGAGKRKGLSVKHLGLAGEAARVHLVGGWQSSMDGWNRNRADRFGGDTARYSNLSLYKRDCLAAHERLLRPPWRRPEHETLYPRFDWGVSKAWPQRNDQETQNG